MHIPLLSQSKECRLDEWDGASCCFEHPPCFERVRRIAAASGKAVLLHSSREEENTTDEREGGREKEDGLLALHNTKDVGPRQPGQANQNFGLVSMCSAQR